MLTIFVEQLYNRLNAQHVEHTKHLQGKLLTIIDASFTDPEQREAVKSLINDNIISSAFALPCRELLGQLYKESERYLESQGAGQNSPHWVSTLDLDAISMKDVEVKDAFSEIVNRLIEKK